jgi:hypothetical protein
MDAHILRFYEITISSPSLGPEIPFLQPCLGPEISEIWSMRFILPKLLAPLDSFISAKCQSESKLISQLVYTDTVKERSWGTVDSSRRIYYRIIRKARTMVDDYHSDSDSEDEDEVIRREADATVNARLKDNTKDKYGRNIKKWEEFVQAKQRTLWLDDDEEGHIDLEHVTPEQYQEFFGWVRTKRKRDGTLIEPRKSQSYEHVSGYKSAIKDYHKQRKVKMSDESENLLSMFFAGYKRQYAQMKQNGDIAMKEGKSPLTFAGYKFLARQAVTATKDFELAIFAWVFLVLCWNLMARCVSVAGIMFLHLSWEEDSLTVVFPTHKGDQEGNDAKGKHVFANRQCPEICPILALAVFIFCLGLRREGSSPKMFSQKESSENRFSKWLRTILGAFEGALVIMGIIILSIGSHSFRKGISTFLAALPGGPSAIAIYLRAGWSLGPVTSRYIMEGGGGDQS